MEVNKKITKIVVSKDDELTDIVTGILDSVNERIIITFAEDSDLLISPINLKVILETADEREKLLVTQIIKNTTGVRNANLAGLMTIESPNLPTEDVWEREIINRNKRLTSEVKQIEKVEDEKKENIKPLEEENIIEPAVSDFQKRINSAIEKSRTKSPSTSEDKDNMITIDDDIPITYEEEGNESNENGVDHIQENKEPSLLTKDFSVKEGELEIKDSTVSIVKNKNLHKSSFFSNLGNIFKSTTIPPKAKKILPIVLVGSIFVTILILLIYYFTVPFVRVRIYVAAKEVSVEKVFDGDENIKKISFDESKIPTKKETVEKSRSSTIQATGIAYSGEKAKGTVAITNIGCEEGTSVNLLQGQSISAGDKAYTLDTTITINCNAVQEVGITAIEVGEEYNLAAGQFFTVQGQSSQKIFGLNSGSALTGGKKEQYTILSQADLNKGIADLKEIAVQEGEKELKDKAGSWEIIATSISSTLDDNSTDSSVAVGAKAGDVNITIKTISTATYYLTDGLEDGISQLLTDEAESKNLFESEQNLELALGDNVEKDISVIQNDKNGVKIKLTAKASVKPKIDKNDIVNKLKGENWESGNSYLKSLNFSEKQTEIEFNPTNFPDNLRYFPDKQGGILVEIKEVF